MTKPQKITVLSCMSSFVVWVYLFMGMCVCVWVFVNVFCQWLYALSSVSHSVRTAVGVCACL